MKKNFFTREVKVGIMAVVAIFLLYFGLNFLKGINIFSPTTYYYASYENVGGLVNSSPVYIKGYKIGQVEEVKYDFSKETPFVVKISVNKDIQVPVGAKLELFDDGLMGGKAVRLVFSPIIRGEKMYVPGDTLPSQVNSGLMEQLSGELMPKIQNISTQADSLLRSVRKLVEGKKLNNSLSSIEKTTSNLAETSGQLNKMMKNDLPHVINNVSEVTDNFKSLSGNLNKIDFAATVASVNHTIANLNLISDKINNSDGSLGLLLNDKQLYINLNNTAKNADNLLIDLKQNPKRYVHFSIFGNKK